MMPEVQYTTKFQAFSCLNWELISVFHSARSPVAPALQALTHALPLLDLQAPPLTFPGPFTAHPKIDAATGVRDSPW